ncbi:2-oxoacid:acceptor oxidoreductase family protein [Leptolinea tardivitalis]|uniref:2-oxoacid:ferredoxin oxidoreductase subunit gamma n=1 Tax=Leptolinea tardivitalis TaxID=229920 RepID=A0A0N8GKU8_9CHLR|nr:2-oxoacid:acceptor oxidoreductase family protein [Leptolinea tardivitalis]KPL70698.1 2-oxoacid:ferredoxin oxidoreductase subunit gamma [Leptolinea tardivitalis]GAP22331.1 pyruvate:ferredoxin oxidoreductase [Leptolinea tardivitalis]
MQTEILIAGFGGQGVLFGGQLMAYAGMEYGKQVTWIPSYGPEMRGGTANCTVIISDEEIGSPLVRHPRVLMAFNLPSLDKYESAVAEGGLLVVNSSMVERSVDRKNVRSILIPANEIAENLGDKRLTNMVMLGAMLANQPVLPLEAVEKALEHHIPERHKRLLPMNIKALRKGAEFKPVAVK